MRAGVVSPSLSSQATDMLPLISRDTFAPASPPPPPAYCHLQSGRDLTVQEAAVVRDALRDYNHEVLKSQELAAREADVEARAYAAWVEARGKGDWGAFSPVMQEVGRDMMVVMVVLVYSRASTRDR